jgi:chromosome segregation ATPase
MNSEDSTTKKLDEIKAQNEAWNAKLAANQAERDRLKEEREKNERDKKKNDDEIARLNAIINNPHSTDEEKKNARNRIVLLEGEIKDLKIKNKKLDENIEKLSKNPPMPSRP